VYNINEKYFDVIDTEDKAYWLGFLWCDGYVCKRDRYLQKYQKYKIEYNIKLSLKDSDSGHLEKFKTYMNSTHPIHIYENTCGYKKVDGSKSFESRLFITNQHMGKTLYDKYGLIPNRSDCSNLVANIPTNLYRHLIRGILDAEGSFHRYYTNERGYEIEKISVQFTTYETLLEFIEKYFYDIGISNTNNYKKYQRHKNNENNDSYCRGLIYSGRIQAANVLMHLYNKSTVYLDRRYIKYKNIINLCA
jgi:hypothetical protein